MNSTITLEAEADLLSAWLSGHADGVTRTHGYPKAGSTWYCIDAAWIRAWQTVTNMSDDFRSHIKHIDNSCLLLQTDSWDPELRILRPDATEHESFVLAPPKAWQFFARNYGYLQGSCIQLYSIETEGGCTEVETHLKPLRVAAVCEFQVQVAPKSCWLSKKTSVSQASVILLRLGNLKARAHRLWRLDVSFDQLEASLAQQQTSNSADSLKFPGSLVPAEVVLACLDSQATYVLELTESMWTFEAADALCSVCRARAADSPCDCGLSACCSACSNLAACCSEEAKDTNEPMNYDDNEISTLTKSYGLVGLRNLGATCFMNAGLQCLSHTRFLTDYFLEDRYLADKNPANPLGFGGLLAEEYSSLLKQMWYSSSQVVHPLQFKRCLGEYASQFQGSQQHDCHEFLSFLLDGLHEDLNRILKKPYVEQSLDQGDDETAAAVAWEAHIDRNSSVIVDLMHGQLRSKVKCQTCDTESTTFDPFMMLSVPIPSQAESHVSVTFIGMDDDEPKVLLIKLGRDKTVRAVLAYVESELGLNEARMEAVILSDGSLSCFLDQSLETPEVVWVYQLSRSPWHVVLETVQGRRVVSFPRLVPMQRGQTFQDLNEAVYLAYQTALGLVFETELPYQLKLPADNSDNNDAALCSICQSNDCTSCALPSSLQSADVLFASTSMPVLQAVWSEAVSLEGLGQVPHFALTEDKPLSLLQCLSNFAEPETLEGTESVYCTACSGHRGASKTLAIYRLPRVLVIHLKRFSQERQQTKKNCTVVDFPLTRLDFSEFVVGNSADEAVYDLYGVVNHYGELSGGHYTADVKIGEVWHTFDDSSVTEGFSGVSGGSYLLFYHRLN
jgi:ubiquitin carboxyl-terminal hydrolase 4/11/15